MDSISVSEKPSSIEVSRNAKGQYAFKVKIYTEAFDENQPAGKYVAVVREIFNTYEDLLSKFK